MTPGLTSGLTSALAPLTMSPSTTSQEAARQRKADKAKDALATLQTLREQRSSASEERKAAARKKVEDLKARIRALQMTMGGDPEAVARVAAQLARELGAAVKAYGATGGSTAGVGGASVSQAGASGSEASEGGTTDSQPVDAEAPVATDLEAVDVEDDVSDTGAANAKDPYRQVIERQQAQAAEQANRNADKEADGKFAADVKGLVAQLRAILQQAAEKARRQGDRTESPDQQAAQKAVDQVTKALGDLASPTSALGGVVSLQI